MDVRFIKPARQEILAMEKVVVARIFALLEDLKNGKRLSMPISRPMPSIARGLHELRISDRSGAYRVFYVIKTDDAIYVVHATKKKTQKTEQKTINLVKNRLNLLD